MISEQRFTHIALPVGDLSAAVEWYERYTPLREIDNPRDVEGNVAWLCHPEPADQPFVLVLVGSDRTATDGVDIRRGELGPNGHLGIELPTRDAVAAMAVLGRADGCLTRDASQTSGGYTCALSDPDGNVVQFGCGQAVSRTAGEALASSAARAESSTAPRLGDGT